LGDARRVIAAAEDNTPEIGQPMNIAVVDAGGILVSHVGMDGASRTPPHRITPPGHAKLANCSRAP
jgi:uncharacterized protein GlcG (DUF336 family)